MKRSYLIATVAALTVFSSCQVVGGIFKAGMWWGIFLVILVVIFILWLFNRGKS
ncbi:hypothetical protein FLA_3544 [Filimonas lacunae]|nr:hypothetical protein FLA_3544 [Filimonas lacunae]